MEEELREQLEKVPDTYDMFVEGIIKGCRTVENGVEKMIAKINSNPVILSSDIVEYLFEMRHAK